MPPLPSAPWQEYDFLFLLYILFVNQRLPPPQLLGAALEEDSHLHAPISLGLQLLIENNKYVADGRTEQGDEAVSEAKTNVAAFASFSRNFLPCLFNVFGATAAENRPVVIKAIEAYVAITDAAVRYRRYVDDES